MHLSAKILSTVIILLLFATATLSTVSTNAVLVDCKKNPEEIYFNYDQLTNLLEQLEQNHSVIFSYQSIGKTYEGRDIWAVKISDNVTIDEDEPEVLFIGGVHGNEKPGFESVIYSINSILQNYSSATINQTFSNRIREIVDSCELYFMPMMNPDGVEANSRKNRRPNDCILGKTLFRGVDINRNSGYKWEEYDKHPFKYSFVSIFALGIRANAKYPFFDLGSIKNNGVYRGPYPFSENETKAFKGFIEEHNITILLDYHTSGEKILYPYSWTTEPAKDEDMFVSISENISNINNFEITQGSKWYNTFGSPKDWAYDTYGVLPLTIELGERINLKSYDKNYILDICKTHVLVNLYAAERAMEL